MFIIWLVVAIICGLISKNITSSRGMEGGFWWGFLVGIFAWGSWYYCSSCTPKRLERRILCYQKNL